MDFNNRYCFAFGSYYERDKIVAEHPGEINEESDFIEYGTDANDSSKKGY